MVRMIQMLLLSFLSLLNETMIRQIGFLTVGISAFIACLLMDYIVKTMQRAIQTDTIKVTVLIIAAAFILTCGKTLYKFLGITSAPIFGVATIHVFMIAFFLVFYLYNKKTAVHYSVSALLCIIYLFCVGKSSIIDKEYFYEIAILMFILSIYDGITNNLSHLKLFRKADATSTKRELTALVMCMVVTAIPAVIVTGNTIMYLLNGLFSSIISFGGGDAYLTVADGLFVDTELITEDEFFGTIVPVVNLLPGSILCKTLSAVGYYIGYDNSQVIAEAIIVAIAGFFASIAASCGVFSVVKYLYENLQQLEIFQIIRKIVRPIVSGLMLTVILSLANQSRKMGVAEGLGWAPVIIMMILFVLNCWLFFYKKSSNVKILGFSTVVALLACNALYME